MEDSVVLFESPEAGTLRLNTEAISHLSTAFVEVEDADLKLAIFSLIQKHSDYVLATSDKILCKQKLHLTKVK
jgi:hypothetical protein